MRGSGGAPTPSCEGARAPSASHSGGSPGLCFTLDTALPAFIHASTLPTPQLSHPPPPRASPAGLPSRAPHLGVPRDSPRAPRPPPGLRGLDPVGQGASGASGFFFLNFCRCGVGVSRGGRGRKGGGELRAARHPLIPRAARNNRGLSGGELRPFLGRGWTTPSHASRPPPMSQSPDSSPGHPMPPKHPFPARRKQSPSFQGSRDPQRLLRGAGPAPRSPVLRGGARSPPQPG